MKTVLERAREEAAEKLEAAKADFDAMERRTVEKRSYDDKRRADWVARIEDAQATLDAIDAAIAAEAPAQNGLTDVTLNLGGNQVVTLKVSAGDAERLMETISKRRASFAGWSEPELKSAVDALEETIETRAPSKKPEPIRIPIVADVSAIDQAIAKAMLNRVDLELDFAGLSIKVSGDGLDVAKVVAFLLEQGKDLATGGIAGADFKPTLVGEQPSGVSSIFSGYVDRESLGEEVDKKEWSVYGAAATSIGPFFDLGDCVRVDTKGSGPVSGMSAIGIVVEIGTLGARRTYRVDFPYGFGLQDSFFTAADLTRINRPDWL